MRPDDDKTQTYAALSKGTVIGHYRIDSRIGSGGMGDVYLAEDTSLSRKVALKFLSPHLCQDESCRKRFTREAQAAAALDHPNIAAIHEVGEYQGRPYYAMQVVEGQSLKEVIAAKDLPIDQVLEIGIQACEGLQAAHDKGIIHRDIKPSNLLLDSHGRVRIVDFGLAAIAGSAQLTKTGSTLGTIGYMSPEQVQGKEVDHRSDLFALGVVLYEMITKRNPFRRDSEAATLRAVSDDFPEPLARFKAGIPEGLQAVVEKALEKDAKTRYQHADEMRADLIRTKRLLESTSTSAPIARAGSRRKRSLVFTIAVLAVVAAAALMITKPWNDADLSKKPQKIMLAVLPFENLGGPDDEYFADGITDEIISKLAGVTGLGVISRTSSMTYKGTGKGLREIADELGVSYILEGTIRWDKSESDERVRITPQLISMKDDSHIWSNSYDKALSGVFAVQSEIAESVAENLGVILLESDSKKLRDSGTSNTRAYLAFLRGLTLSRSNPTKEHNAQSMEAYEEALTLDPKFARVWAELSAEYSYLYHNWEKSPELPVKAEAAAHQSLILNPSLAEGHVAMGYYYYWCLGDYEVALDEFRKAEVLEPRNARIMEAAAYVWRRQGRFAEARERLERTLKFSPRDALLIAEIAATCLVIPDYSATCYYAELALATDPEMSWAYNYLIEPTWDNTGDLSLTRHYLEQWGFSKNNIDMWFRQFIYERNYENAIDSLQSCSMEAYDGGLYYPAALLIAETLKLGGDTAEAYAYFDSARVSLAEKARQFPNDPRYSGSLGLALAGLGRDEQAIESGRKAVNLCPVEHDAFAGPIYVENLMYIYLSAEDYDSALREAEYLLSIPGTFSAQLMKLDPRFDPVRGDPRFKALIKKYENRGET